MQSFLLPTTFQDNGDLLKKCLLQFPRRYDYEFSNATKVDLRRALFFAASYKGEYLKNFFNNVDESVLPTAWQHVLAPERYQHLESESLYFSDPDNPDPHHPNRSCGKKFKKGETIYRCITCNKDESSGLCSNCYDENEHKDHDVVKSISLRGNAGVCDCGDKDGWKFKFKCKYHDIEETPESEIPSLLTESLFQTFEIVLDYVVDVMSGSHSSLLKDQTQDNESILRDSFKSTLDEEKYFGTNWSCDKFELLLYNDQNKQYREAIDRICQATNKGEDYAIMIADEVNAIGRAKVLTSSHLEELLEAQKILDATGLPTCIKSSRDVFREEMCVEIIQWLSEISCGHLMGNYNITRNILSMAFCRKWDWGIKIRANTEILSTIESLYGNKIPLVSKKNSNSFNSVPYWNIIPEPWKIDPKLTQQCDYDPFISSPEKSSFLHGSRFQYLLYFDTKLWKSFKNNLHDLFNSVLTTNQFFKSLICCQYVDIYPTLLELFFRYDKSPEQSAMTNITSQIFTSASNATMITEHGDLTRLLAGVFGFLTKLTVIHPADVDVTLDLATTSFKNRKIGQVFYDICCILSKTESFSKVLNQDLINQICDLVILFQGRPTVRREALEHVEYETNDFGIYFNIYSLIVSISDTTAKCLIKAPDIDPNPLIEQIFDRIHGLIFNQNVIMTERLNEKTDLGRPVVEDIDTIEGVLSPISFEVHKKTMSLLHPLHAFFSCFVQYSQVKSLQFENFSNFLLNLNKHYILDYPLRVFVMLSQIKVGFWVRNGLTIKTQMQIYKSTGIRESGYMRDLSLIQIMMINCKPSFSMITFIDRWALLHWLREDFGNYDDYDEKTLISMVEEFLLFLIHTLTDISFLNSSEHIVEDRCAKQIIHTLFFEPLTYSKLRSELPDFISQEKCLDIYLDKVAELVPSKDKGHPGTFKIKDQYLDQINPFYIHYTSNQRESAEKFIKETIAKNKKIKIEDAFIPPVTPNLEGTLFSKLYQITTSKIFVQFLKSTLKFVDHDSTGKSESILDLALHLIHLGVEGKDKSYSFQFCENLFLELKIEEHNEPFYYESVGSLLYKLLKNDSFNSLHAKIRAIFKSITMSTTLIVHDYLKEQVENYDSSILGKSCSNKVIKLTDFERKKKLAQERRAKLMEKFKKQQNKFVEKNAAEKGKYGYIKDVDDDIEMKDNNDDEGDLSGNHWKYPDHHCYLCQMPKDDDDEVIGVVCNIYKTSVARRIPFQDKYWSLRSFHEAINMDSDELINKKTVLDEHFAKIREDLVMGPSFDSRAPTHLINEVTSSSCGHAMHYSCYKNYLIENKTRQHQITRTVPEDFEDDEFICPLCKSIGNTFFPLLWHENKSNIAEFVSTGFAEDNSWYNGLESFSKIPILDNEVIVQFKSELATNVHEKLKCNYKDLFFRFDSRFAQNLHESWKLVVDKINKKSAPMFTYNPAKLISSLIRSIEISTRGVSNNDGLIVNQITHQQITVLRLFLAFQEALTSKNLLNDQLMDTKENRDSFNIKLSQELLAKLKYFESDDIFNTFGETDIFEFMISIFACFEVTNYSIYRLGYIYFIIQTISTLLSQLKENLFETEFSFFGLNTIKSDEETLNNLYKVLKVLRDRHPIFDFLSDEVFESREFIEVFNTLLVKSITTFLRKLAIYVFGKCGNLENSMLNEALLGIEGLECDRLCLLLNLPKISEIYKNFSNLETIECQKFNKFLNFVQVTSYELDFEKLEFPGMIKLIDLPKNLHDIFTKLIYLNKDYEEKLKYGLDPAICLTCGSILHLQKQAPLKRSSKKLGECNYHLQNECLSQLGMFLLPKHNSMILLNKSGKGSFYSIPYTDDHGSLEIEGKGSKVLTLDEDKYDLFIRKMWLNNEINNFITRKLEGVLDIGGWESF